MKDYPLNTSTPLDLARLIRPDLLHLLPGMTLEELEVNQIRKMLFLSYGWRANNYGIKILTTIYNNYQITSEKPIDRKISAKIILGMDRICQSPWFINNNQIIIFDNLLYFELALSDGDIEHFIDCKSR